MRNYSVFNKKCTDGVIVRMRTNACLVQGLEAGWKLRIVGRACLIAHLSKLYLTKLNIFMINKFTQWPVYTGRSCNGIDLSRKIVYHRTSPSLRSTLMLNIHSVIFIRLRLFYRTQDLYVSAQDAFFLKFSLRNRFDHTTPLCFGLQSRVLSY